MPVYWRYAIKWRDKETTTECAYFKVIANIHKTILMHTNTRLQLLSELVAEIVEILYISIFKER